MAGGGGCRDERRESSASEVGTVDGTEGGGKTRKKHNFTCSWYLVFVPELSVANVIFSRLIKDQAGKNPHTKKNHTQTKPVEPRPKLPEPQFCTKGNSHQFCRDEAGSFWQHSTFPLHFHSNTAVPLKS